VRPVEFPAAPANLLGVRHLRSCFASSFLALVVPVISVACGTAQQPSTAGGGDANASSAAVGGDVGAEVASSGGESTSSGMSSAGSTSSGASSAGSTSSGGPASARYDEVRAKAVHNAYQRFEGLFDQLVYHRARALELDLHVSKSGWPTVPGDFFVYHDGGDGETSCHRLSDCLDAIASFRRVVPAHEVITLILDLKATLEGPNHGPDDLDARLEVSLGKGALFTPAELVASCPGATTLRGAVTGACGWPSLDALRGKVVVVLTGGSACSAGGPMGYLGAAATKRRAFAAAEVTSDCGVPKLEAKSDVVFANMSFALRASAAKAHAAGLVTRVWSANDATAWDDLVLADVNLLATDKVNVSADPWARTHSTQGYPFACLGSCALPLEEAAPLVSVSVRSADLWGKKDGFYFVSKSYGTEARSHRAWVSVESSHVEEWAKGCFMARETLDADSPYFAVCRAADRHLLRIQHRRTKGGDTKAIEAPVAAPDTVDGVDVPFVRLAVAAGGKSATGYGSVDGVSWVPIGSEDFDGPLTHQGLAASGHSSPSAVRFVFGGILTTSGGVDSKPLGVADFTKKTPIGDCTSFDAHDGVAD